MDKIIALISEQVSPWLLLPVLAFAWVLQATGIVGHLLGAKGVREDREAAERIAAADRESRDHTAEMGRLITFNATLQAELTDIRRRHALDIADWDRRLRDMHAEAEDARRDAKRWRHLIGSIGSHLMVQRRLLERNRIEAPRFDWTAFVSEGGDPSEFEGFD